MFPRYSLEPERCASKAENEQWCKLPFKSFIGGKAPGEWVAMTLRYFILSELFRVCDSTDVVPTVHFLHGLAEGGWSSSESIRWGRRWFRVQLSSRPKPHCELFCPTKLSDNYGQRYMPQCYASQYAFWALFLFPVVYRSASSPHLYGFGQTRP